MLIGETIRVALASIRANKLRALLTMLGVIIGVAAVITVVAMGTGAQKAVEDKINSLGASLVQINAGQGMNRDAAVVAEVLAALAAVAHARRAHTRDRTRGLVGSARHAHVARLVAHVEGQCVRATQSGGCLSQLVWRTAGDCNLGTGYLGG